MVSQIIVHNKIDISQYRTTCAREAARAIIHFNGLLLLIFSENVGDYKFPGGGIEQNESHSQCLIREVKEESGYTVTHIGKKLIEITEYNQSNNSSDELFKMVSHYYVCSVTDTVGNQNLDEYELKLGFVPKWIKVEDAIKSNKAIKNGNSSKPAWLDREIWALEQLQKTFT
jgi:8-oxo-dGTP pyrophosphatase MutT (NUDIX family)